MAVIDVTGLSPEQAGAVLVAAQERAAWEGERTVLTFDGQEIAFVGTLNDLETVRLHEPRT